MTINFCSLFTVLALAAHVATAGDFLQDSVRIVQSFEPGRTYHLEVQRRKHHSEDRDTIRITGTTPVELTITGAHDGLKLCSWKYGTTKLSGVDPALVDVQTKQLMNVYEGLEVMFLVNQDGMYQQMANFERCKAQILSTVRTLLNSGATAASPEDVNTIVRELEASLTEERVLADTFFPELPAYFSFFGKTLTADSSYKKTDTTPNPFGGERFPFIEMAKLVFAGKQEARIHVAREIPEKDLNEILTETFRELNASSGQIFDEKLVPKFRMRTDSYYGYDRVKKRLSDLVMEKTVEIDNTKQMQFVRVKLLDR